jgi:phosphoribosylformylglycinamidine synthase I
VKKPKKFGVVVFPGSNCDMDCYWALRTVLRQHVHYLWHKNQAGKEYDCIILPGGFSYGDYLRTGAIARFSPIMRSISELARRGNLILGICNGFQILCEAGLLPGALRRNQRLSFICKYLHIRCDNHETPFSRFHASVLKIPIAHGQGNYFIRPDGLEELRQNNQIVFRYCDAQGSISDEANPNGSVANIAGITNRGGNVLGMMPHPERSSETQLGSTDGRQIFESVISHFS